MASSDFHGLGGGADFYPTAPYVSSREGLTQRPAAAGSDSGEIYLQIDALECGLGDEITGLRKQVGQLKHVAQDIQIEAKFQKRFINKMQMTLTKAHGGTMNNMKRMSRTIIKEGSNHILHVVLFALFCFSLVFLWSKFLQK